MKWSSSNINHHEYLREGVREKQRGRGKRVEMEKGVKMVQHAKTQG